MWPKRALRHIRKHQAGQPQSRLTGVRDGVSGQGAVPSLRNLLKAATSPAGGEELLGTR